jgi:hypothetical protein
MPKMSPVHSSDPNNNRHVHHDNSACTEQNNIEAKWRKSGTNNWPLCHHCKTLNDEGK